MQINNSQNINKYSKSLFCFLFLSLADEEGSGLLPALKSMCKQTLSLSLRLGVVQVGHGGAVPFGALLLLPHAQRPALTSVAAAASSPLVQHFHGDLVVGVLALGVPAERVALGEARVAELALVGLLPGVDPLVALELARLPEAFGTYGAHKVSLAGVDVLVSLQKGGGWGGGMSDLLEDL